MKSYSENILLTVMKKSRGFSLVEIAAALVILSFICASVFVVIDRCLTSTADSTLKMQAFEIARENMETLLSQDTVKEKVDYGISDKYPNIEWETNIEPFYEPLTSQMWLRAVCSAQYTDSREEQQRVELTHWLTNVTREQLIQIMKEMKNEQLAQRKVEEEEEEEKQPTPPKDDGPCGYTWEELAEMPDNEIWDIFVDCYGIEMDWTF